MRLLTILLLALSINLLGQSNDSASNKFNFKNIAQIELMGNGLFYSLGYERVITNRNRWKTTGLVSIAYYPPSTGVISLWIPVILNALYSISDHHIELGIGHIFTDETELYMKNEKFKETMKGFFSGRLGYRFQKPNQHFVFKVAFTPFVDYLSKDFHPSGGLAFGYSF